jgi:DnaJ-class molecular chaperone
MYDLSQPNEKPGICGKCRGTGAYSWGAMVNGKMTHSGTCFSCRGTGRQDRRQIARNAAYNRFKIAAICSGSV